MSMTTPRVTVPVDELAQEIRRVDGNHDLGAGALAEALMPFLSSRLSAAPAPEGGAVGRDQVLAIVRQFASPSWCSVDRLVDTLLAALSPEAPAREGEVIGPWRIAFYQPPIPTRNCDWSYCHEDYDGPDSPSWMSGHAATRDECIAAIFHQYEERMP